MSTKKAKMENGERDKNNDNSAWIFELGFKLDRLNENLERQIKIWSWPAVLFRAILNSIGYIVGLAILAAIAGILASRYINLPEGGLFDSISNIIGGY